MSFSPESTATVTDKQTATTFDDAIKVLYSAVLSYIFAVCVFRINKATQTMGTCYCCFVFQCTPCRSSVNISVYICISSTFITWRRPQEVSAFCRNKHRQHKTTNAVRTRGFDLCHHFANTELFVLSIRYRQCVCTYSSKLCSKLHTAVAIGCHRVSTLVVPTLL